MTRYERAAQLWSVLTLAARHQHILSYDIAGRLTGLPRQAVGDNLAPIQCGRLVSLKPEELLCDGSLLY